MHHGFDIDLAKKYGVHAAILLEYIAHWVIYNRSLNQNRVDGKFWTYNTNAAMCEQFPYLNKRQIEYTIKQLNDAGLIAVRKLNINKMSHANWYTLTAKGERVCGCLWSEEEENHDSTKMHQSIAQNCSIDSTKMHQSIAQNCSIDSTKMCDDKDLIHYNITNKTLHTLPPLPPTEKGVEKIKYADYVHMKESEYNTLVDKYGEQPTKEFIDILDNYKGSKGRCYKDDYRAILSWVVKKWQDDHIVKNTAPKSFKQMEQERFLEVIKEMDELHGNK